MTSQSVAADALDELHPRALLDAHVQIAHGVALLAQVVARELGVGLVGEPFYEVAGQEEFLLGAGVVDDVGSAVAGVLWE